MEEVSWGLSEFEDTDEWITTYYGIKSIRLGDPIPKAGF